MRLWLFVLTVAGVALAACSASAQTITLGRAIEEGARRGPSALEASHVSVVASSFARDHGGSLPSVPQATIMAGARDPLGLPIGPEIVVTVQQEVSFRSLGSARKRASDWAARAATSDLERARLEGASAAALSWVDLLEAQELLVVRTTAWNDANRLAKIAEARVVSGVATAVERSLALAEIGTAQIALLDVEDRSRTAKLSLALAIGTPMETAVFFADGRLDATDEAVPNEPAVIARVTSGASFVAADAHARQLGAEALVMHAALGPTFSFGASVWREGSGDKAAAAIVSVPLPFFDPARYDTARQSTLAATATARADRVRLELEREARLALHEREHTREIRAAVQTSLVLPLRTALASAVLAYAAGTNDLAVVLLARRATLNAEERSIFAMANVQRADIKLATLAGTLVKK